jgi:hypothetical protein
MKIFREKSLTSKAMMTRGAVSWTELICPIGWPTTSSCSSVRTRGGSQGSRRKEFVKLTDPEVSDIEAIVREAFAEAALLDREKVAEADSTP